MSLGFLSRLSILKNRQKNGSAPQPAPLQPIRGQTNHTNNVSNAKAQGLPLPTSALLNKAAAQAYIASGKGLWPFTKDAYDAPTRHPNATIISWDKPRIVLLRNFVTPQEVEHFIGLAASGWTRSEVVDDEHAQSEARTSYGAWLNGARRTPVVKGVQARIADLLSIPETFGESIYVLRYAHGQKYKAHADNCNQPGVALAASCKGFLERAGGPACGSGAGGVTCGDRLATVITYLQYVYEISLSDRADNFVSALRQEPCWLP